MLSSGRTDESSCDNKIVCKHGWEFAACVSVHKMTLVKFGMPFSKSGK